MNAPSCRTSDRDLQDRLMQVARQIGDPTPTGPGQAVAGVLAAVTQDLTPGVEWASLTRHAPSRKPDTIAFSDPDAAAVDALQYASGDGPCLHAISTGTTTVTDFGTESRWPAFITRATRDTAARAALSYPLGAGGHPQVSLNLYSRQPHAFDGSFGPLVAITAAATALALSAAMQRERADNLQTGLLSNRQIGAAIGILMHRHRWTNEQAFDALRVHSQDTQRKLHDIAEEVVLTGTLPSRKGR